MIRRETPATTTTTTTTTGRPGDAGVGRANEERVDIVGRLRERSGEAIVGEEEFRGDLTLTVAREHLHEVLELLRRDPALEFNFLVDVTGVDHLARGRTPRFDVVYHLCSMPHHRRVRVKCTLDEDDLWAPTATDIWQGAEWFEREAWDMYGIVFEGHPNLRRLLCHDAFEGHPLRKDFPADKRFFLARPATLRDEAPEWVRERSAAGAAGGYIPD